MRSKEEYTKRIRKDVDLNPTTESQVNLADRVGYFDQEERGLKTAEQRRVLSWVCIKKKGNTEGYHKRSRI